MKGKVTITNILLIFSSIVFMFILFHYIFLGFTTLPTEGDSINIHIPIARKILAGKILLPVNHNIDSMYPAASELILSIFLGLQAPLNLYNIFALLMLFVTLFFLGKTFNLSKNLSIYFSFSICSLYDVLRYANTQKIDIWMLIFYALSLLFLQKQKKRTQDFLLLGIFFGMFVGSKYSAPFYGVILLIFYFKSFLKYLNMQRFFVFIFPLFLLGISWYIRNYINFGNPFFPQPFLFFKGESHSLYYSWPYWKIALEYPREVFNAFISEYMIWVLLLIVLPLLWFGNMLFKKFQDINSIQKILFLGIVNFIFFIFLPSAPAHDYNAIVFGIRYSLPAILILFLSFFCIAKKYKLGRLVTIITFANMSFLLLPINYHAKLLFLYVPATTIFIVLLTTLLKNIAKDSVSENLS